MYGRVAFASCFATALLLFASLAEAAPETPAALPEVSLRAAGNVTVARLTIKSTATSGAPGAPRLALATKSGFPAAAFVVASIGRAALPGRFLATVAIIDPSTTSTTSDGSQPDKLVTLRLPRGFSLSGAPQVAKDVLYRNPTPPFGLAAGGTGVLLAGEAPSKLPIARIVRDVELLALDRSVPLADVELLGLPYVAAQVPRTRTTTLPVTIGLSRLSQVNAVELRFPAGIKVAKASGPPNTDALLIGNAVRLVASRGFFQEGLPYSFTLQLSRPPKKGEFLTLRASEHYFEGSLPFTERFALS
jgi:hypothetical protein